MKKSAPLGPYSRNILGPYGCPMGVGGRLRPPSSPQHENGHGDNGHLEPRPWNLRGSAGGVQQSSLRLWAVGERLREREGRERERQREGGKTKQVTSPLRQREREREAYLGRRVGRLSHWNMNISGRGPAKKTQAALPPLNARQST